MIGEQTRGVVRLVIWNFVSNCMCAIYEHIHLVIKS